MTATLIRTEERPCHEHGSGTRSWLVAEAKAAYGKMPRAMQADYRAAVRSAIAVHPKAWITALKFFR